MANLELQMKEKNKKIAKLEKDNLELQNKLNLLGTKAAKVWGELKMMRVMLAEKKDEIDYMRNKK